MKNHELLDVIGEVKEEYVLAADEPDRVIRPRWRTWAAAAACAALVLCAYPLYRSALANKPLENYASSADCPAPLHSYTLVEGGRAEQFRAEFAPADGTVEDAVEDTEDGGDSSAGFSGGMDGGALEDAMTPEAPGGENGSAAATGGGLPQAAPSANGPIPDPDEAAPDEAEPVYDSAWVPMLDQNKAISQYHALLRGMGVPDGTVTAENSCPDWYAGAWLDNDYEDHVSRLRVALVEGYHTTGLEEQIAAWCGDGVVYAPDMKYSYARLTEMQNQVFEALSDPAREPDWAGFCAMGTDIEENCLWVCFSGEPSDNALALLAQLDPEGDAIRVQAYADHAIADVDVYELEPTSTPAVISLPPDAETLPET